MHLQHGPATAYIKAVAESIYARVLRPYKEGRLGSS